MLRPLLCSILCFPLLTHAQLPCLIPYKKGHLWGYADSTGRIVHEPRWLEVTPFDSNGLAQVAFSYLDHRGDSSWYSQVIDRSGKPVIPHQDIIDFAIKHSQYTSYIAMTIEQNSVRVEFEEGSTMKYDFKGNLIFISLDERSEIYQTNQYAYVFNRQIMEKHRRWSKRESYFADRFANRKSPYYNKVDDDFSFNHYWLFKLESYNGFDSTALNPDGPAAWVRRGRYQMLVDTNFKVLYKYKWKHRKAPQYSNFYHPKDTLQYHNGGIRRRFYPVCMQMNARFDSLTRSKLAYFNWSGRQVTPYIYDYPTNYSVYRFLGCNIPYTLVKKDSFYSYMDTFGKVLMPFTYKNISHYNGRYGIAFDTAWHWISKEGAILSPNQYKNIEWFNGEYGKGYDTAWHYIDEYGHIILEPFMRKGYEIVPHTRLSLLFDPVRKIYVDKYGREYFEP